MNKVALGLGIIGLLGVGYILTKGHPKQKIIPSGSAIQGIPQIVTIGAGASKKESIPTEKPVVYNVKVEAPNIGGRGVPPQPHLFDGGHTKKSYSGKTGTWTYEPDTGVLTSPSGSGYSTAYPEQMIAQQESAIKPTTKKDESPSPLRPEFEPIFNPNVVWTPTGGVSTAFPSSYW